MKQTKNKVLILVMIIYVLALSGCGKNQEVGVEEHGVNFYKEYFNPENTHREEEIQLKEGCEEVEIQGTTTSGTIHVVLENKDEQGVKYEYDIDGSFSETIPIEKKHVNDRWVLCTDINEETEGSILLLFR